MRHLLSDDEEAKADRDRQSARERCGSGRAERGLERQEECREAGEKPEREEETADDECRRGDAEAGGGRSQDASFFTERF